MSITIRSTKSAIMAHLATMELALIESRNTVRKLRDDLAMAQPVFKPASPIYKDYLVALRDSNRVAFASGARHNPFPSFATWSAA